MQAIPDSSPKQKGELCLTFTCAIRETYERVSITIKESDDLFTIQDNDWFHSSFLAKKWLGKEKDREPTKCSEIIWCNIKMLPENITLHFKIAVNFLLSVEFY